MTRTDVSSLPVFEETEVELPDSADGPEWESPVISEDTHPGGFLRLYHRLEETLQQSLNTDGHPHSVFLKTPQQLDELAEQFEISFYSADGLEVDGFAAYLELGSGVSIAEMLEASGLDVCDCYFDQDDRMVQLSELCEFAGFEDYSGRGAVTYLHQLEAFVPGKGIGSALLADLVQNTEIELIFLHAQNDQAADFFLERGFVESGVFCGDEPVLVYRNPFYGGLQ